MSFRYSRKTVQTSSGRRLSFESLERRDLLAVMRIVDWNALNGPGDDTSDGYFRTVLQAIGNETVQGNTQRIDILALQETDTAAAGGNSIGRVESIMDGLYPATNYAFAATPIDGGGDATGFVYDTGTVSLVGSAITVGAGTLTHNVLRGQFRPVGTAGESDFYVYTIHLKSGETGGDATTRGTEAAFLRADADALNSGIDGPNVLFVGDFNMKTSDEAAYVNFLASGNGQLQDVAGAPGDWNDDAAFKSLHSQDPRRKPADTPAGMGTGMDDRFDIQFASDELFDGIGLEYVANSYHVFGNNGTHALNGSIATGTGASPTVLDALTLASDHLPVVADYQFLISTPRVRITQTLSGTTVGEGGTYDTYHVVLDTVPAANVFVTVTPNGQLDVGNGAGVAKVLTFTPANAFTPQTVVVNAYNDAVNEGYHSGSITHTSASSDAAYNALIIDGVSVAIADNDPVKWVINEVDADTSGTDTMEFVELYDGGVGNVSLTGLTLVFFNGGGTDAAYKVFDLTGFSTDSDGFFLVGNSGVSGVDLTFPNDTLQNGEDAVALYSGSFSVGGAVTTTNLIDAVVYDTGDPDDPELLTLLDHTGGTQPQVNEAQGNTSATKSISRVPDGGAQRKTTSYVVQAPTPGTYNVPQVFGVEFLQSAARIDIQEGGATDTYQVSLQHLPSADVTMTIDPDNQTNLGSGAGVPIMLTFTPTNGLTPQTITVTAVDDVAIEGVHLSTITHSLSSADSRYNGLPVGSVVANIVDNDFVVPPSIAITEIMYNPAGTETASITSEWIEIVNTGTAATDLGGWYFDDEDPTNWGAIPANTILQPHQIAVFFDSAFTNEATFRSEWPVPASALVVGVKWGNLANTPGANDEILRLVQNIGVDGTTIDTVDYDDGSPWPSGANGPSIYLKGLSLDNNNGANWARSVAGTARAIHPSGSTFSTSDVGSPGRFFLPADYDLDASVNAGDYVLWRFTLGTSNPQADGSGASVGVPNGVVDTADYTYWQTNFGAVGASSTAAAASLAQVSLSEGPTSTNTSSNQIAAKESATTSTVDAAVFDFGQTGAVVTESISGSSNSLSNTAVATSTSVNLLLILDRALPAAQASDSSMDGLAVSSDDYFEEVDQLFASLDESNLLVSLL